MLVKETECSMYWIECYPQLNILLFPYSDKDADKSNDDMDGASALAALASAAASTAENSTENGKSSSKENSSNSNNGTTTTKSSTTPQESKRDANWFDVGIIKGSSCTVSSYYLPSGDGERPEIDVEGMYCTCHFQNKIKKTRQI